jgi:hypothetical protein
MADSNSSVSSWPGFVDQLNKTFMLIRDVFGYALPGAVFLAIGLISRSFFLCEVDCLIYPYHFPVWLAFFAVIAVSYAMGGVMASIAYMLFMLTKYFVWMLDRHFPIPAPIGDDGPHPKARKAKAWRALRTKWTEWLVNHPTEVTGNILKTRLNHPTLLETLDRRETLGILAGSMAAALLTGWFVFIHARWSFDQILVWAGIITAIQFLTGLPHLRRVAQATREASVDAPKPEPDFPQLLADLIKAAQKAAASLEK